LQVILNDSDHDGVTDQLDKEPNTSVGCAVDMHGITLDTDGDGVPNCKDKEKLTQRACFPVNQDGIGTCPEPECCNHGIVDDLFCRIYSFPAMQFEKGSDKLTADQNKILDSVATVLKNHPECIAVVQAYYDIKINFSEQLTIRRLKNVIEYLTRQRELDKSRLIANPVAGKKINTIDFIPGAN